MEWPEKSELKDAARLALQTAVSASAMYVVMRATGLPEVFVGVLSAVLIVQPSLGRTFGSGMQRVLATVVGCAIGVATVLVIPYGYSTAGALAIAMLVMNAIVSFKPDWRYGVVAAIAISISAEEGAIEAAGYRSLSIGIGAAIGTLASLVVWPEKASDRAERRLIETVRHLLRALRASASHERAATDPPEWRGPYREYINQINTLVAGVRIADNDHLIARRDAVDQFAQSLVVFERYTRSRMHADEASEAEQAAISDINDLASELIESLESSGHPGAMPVDRWRERASELQEPIGDQEQAGDRDQRGAGISFAMSDVKTALRELADAFQNRS